MVSVLPMIWTTPVCSSSITTGPVLLGLLSMCRTLHPLYPINGIDLGAAGLGPDHWAVSLAQQGEAVGVTHPALLPLPDQASILQLHHNLVDFPICPPLGQQAFPYAHPPLLGVIQTQ